jgi:3-oxoacyl-[acyl-carrier protein] reductase
LANIHSAFEPVYAYSSENGCKDMDMELNLKGKVAVVTGASKGIGAGIALTLSKAGAAVIANYQSDEAGAKKVVEQIEAAGGRAIAVQADVSNASDVVVLFETAVRAFERIDIVVNNAGVFTFGPVTDITEQAFNERFGSNVLGPVLTTQQALKYFPKTGGSIINISSGSSRYPAPYSSLYAMTKGALDVLTKALAVELAPRNIRVNAVAPGATETEGAHRIGAFDGDAAQAFIAATPLGRIGQPEDIALAVLFLASDASRWITGERISAAGGWELKH